MATITIPDLEIPEKWIPSDDSSAWDRCFRAELDIPVDGIPVLKGHMERAWVIGAKTVKEYQPDQQLSIDLATALADPEIGALAAAKVQIDSALLYLLWQRKQNETSSEG